MSSQKKMAQNADEVKQCRKEVQLQTSSHSLKLQLIQEVLRIEVEDKQNPMTFVGELSELDIRKHIKLQHYFDQPSDVFDYLQKFHQKITLTEDDQLSFPYQVPGKHQPVMILIKMKKSSKDICEYLVKEMGKCKQEIALLKEEKVKKQLAVSLSDKEIASFVIDHNNIQFGCFKKTNNFVNKVSSGSWEPLFGLEIKPQTIYRYRARLVSGSSNIIYGIGTNQVRNTKNISDELFLGYHAANGTIYPKGQNSKGGSIGMGQTMEVNVDLKQYSIRWCRDGGEIASRSIPSSMRSLPIFPVIFMGSPNETIQLMP